MQEKIRARIAETEIKMENVKKEAKRHDDNIEFYQSKINDEVKQKNAYDVSLQNLEKELQSLLIADTVISSLSGENAEKEATLEIVEVEKEVPKIEDTEDGLQDTGDTETIIEEVKTISGIPIYDIKPWRQPGGVHDAYSINYPVEFEGEYYVSNMNGNTWSPRAFSTVWTKVSI